MFRAGFLKLRQFYNKQSKIYASLIVKYPFAAIICYLVLLLGLNFGMFQISLIADSESLTIVQNSQVIKDSHQLDNLFQLNQSNYFVHKLNNLGHYAEVILKLKNNNESFVNRTVLEKYNQFFDEIISINITDEEFGVNLTYENGLCPKRFNKCAIEGGILREESFQEKLLNLEVNYDLNDPLTRFMDTTGGVSIGFLFGKNHECKYEGKRESIKCFLTSAIIVRNRFDLIYQTSREKRLALKFMQSFVDHMEYLIMSEKYSLFDISYSAPDTLQKEVEKYSKIDIQYVLFSFGAFWFIFWIFMCFDLAKLRGYFAKKITNSVRIQENLTISLFFKYLKQTFISINCSSFLALASFIQFILTITSTIGTMSLFSVPVNHMLYSIVFVLMIINCHQSLMIYRNVKLENPRQRSNQTSNSASLESSNIDNLELEVNEKMIIDQNDYKIQEIIENAVQIVIVPSFCTLLTFLFAYLIIGITSQFASIKFYCSFLGKII